MKIDKKEYWMLLFPVLAGFGLPVLTVGLLGLHRNPHQENAFFAVFITIGFLMYAFYKTAYRRKHPEKFERMSSSFFHIASALFFSCLSASIVATGISLISAPIWFHIAIYVSAPLVIAYVFFKSGFKL